MIDTSSGRILASRVDLPWLPKGGSAEVVVTNKPPPTELVTSVHALCFQGADLLVIEHEKRKQDIPGGHVEAGETLEGALRRELSEEAKATISRLALIGVIKVSLSGEKPEGYRYPFPVSYMAFYAARVECLHEFVVDYETTARQLLNPEQARQSKWVQEYPEFYEIALQVAGTSRA